LDSFTKAVLNKLAESQPLRSRPGHRAKFPPPDDRKQQQQAPQQQVRAQSPKEALHTWSFSPDLAGVDAPLRVAKGALHRHRSRLTLDESEHQWRLRKLDMDADDPISWRLKHVIHADADDGAPPPPTSSSSAARPKRLHSAKVFDFDTTVTNENELRKLQREIAGENSWLSYIKEQTTSTRRMHPDVRLLAKQHNRSLVPLHHPKEPLPPPPPAETTMEFDENKLEMIQSFLQDVEQSGTRSSGSNSSKRSIHSHKQRLPLFGIRSDETARSTPDETTAEESTEEKEPFADLTVHALTETRVPPVLDDKKTKSAARRRPLPPTGRPSLGPPPKPNDPKNPKLDLDGFGRIAQRPIPEEHFAKYFKYVEQYVNDNIDTVSAWEEINGSSSIQSMLVCIASSHATSPVGRSLL
jgi:hypothetical protein